MKQRMSRGIAHPRFIQFISIALILASTLLFVSSAIMIWLPHDDSNVFIHGFGVIFSFLTIAIELSLSGNQQYGPNVANFLPFIKTRYGRAIFYVFSGLLIYFLCHGSMAEQMSSQFISFCGILLGLIAMQSGNTLDYRGF